MDSPTLVLQIAAGILLANFLAWMIRGFVGSYLRTRSTMALAVSGGLIVVCAYAIAALAT